MNGRNHFFVFFKGMGMGIAEVIPGVSGGTIAFITGIYERLLNCIKSFNLSLFGAFKKEGTKGLWQAVDGLFLATLLAGMATGVIVGVLGVTYLLEQYPEPLWAFFFGLIIASAVYIGKQIEQWSVINIVLLLVGATVAYCITLLPMGQGSDSLLYTFLAGAIAISALILPGISGSFILLLMGMYTIIIPTIKTALKTFEPNALMVLIVFGLGCLLGLITFSRLLSWTFKNHKTSTFAILTGFMIGSLNKIWPWRIPLEVITTDEGKEKIVRESNLLPTTYEQINGNEAHLVLCITLFIVGLFLVLGLDYWTSKKEAES
ncbi:DUF368 domain-containing protein [Aureispira]|nr:DUF368 domain-containing protein [Aureispira sp.]